MRRDVPSITLIQTGDGGRIPAYPIHCSRCRKKDGMPALRTSRPIPWLLYYKHWHHKGWELGKAGNVCPACLDQERQDRLARHAHRAEAPSSGTRTVARDAAAQNVVGDQLLQRVKQLQEKFNTYRQPSETETLRQENSRLKRENMRLRMKLRQTQGSP
jgi:hypothetical protein